MQKHLFDQKPFKKTYIPDGMAKDIAAFCKEYDQIIKDNPIDIQLLGIGQNGHIAFNEPGTPFDIGTHEVKLTENTIKANARFLTASMKCQRVRSAWVLLILCNQRRSF